MADPSTLADLYPPFGLVIRSGDLTLRTFRDEDLPEYAALLRRPIFDRDDAPYVFPWYQVPEEERLVNSVQFQWHHRAGFGPKAWSLPLGIWANGVLVGSQDVSATDFATRRVVESGSWLTLDAHGRGHGGLMRRAVLAFAFDHLGARRAESSAEVHNSASIAVSHSCGYQDNGTKVATYGDASREEQAFVATPETFVRRDVEIEVEGLTPALLRMMGADGA
jgi:RimJ/RimL family protein N-acetyltransferase